MITIIASLSIIITILSILIYETSQPCDNRCRRCGHKLKKDKEFIKNIKCHMHFIDVKDVDFYQIFIVKNRRIK